MLETRSEADLALEAVGAERGGELGMEHLEGDGAVVAEILGQVDVAMPSRPSSRWMA